MIKKTLIILFILATLTAITLNILSRKAPEFLRGSLERALNKKVVIQSIEYQFPWVFELKGFEIQEKEPFLGEHAFYADQVRLEVSPLSLSNKRLIIHKIEVENADIVIRKFQGDLFHALSNTLKTAVEETAEGTLAVSGAPLPPSQIPLEIHRFYIKRSHFKFMDYEVEQNGFVIAFQEIDATIRDIRLPVSAHKTFYDIKAVMPQGREQKAAEIAASGWTQFAGSETDANFSLRGVFLPYFRPYYAQVTSATIEDGYVDTRANVRIQNKDLTASVDIEMIGLLFRAYEEEDQLFGLKADELLSFLKDRSGKLRFQIVLQWDMKDRSVKLKDVIRKSIERSLKSTVLGNIGNILQKTIERISEKGGFEQAKKDPDGVLNKIKSYFK